MVQQKLNLPQRVNELKIEGKYKEAKLYGNRKVSGIVNKINSFLEEWVLMITSQRSI